MNEGQAALVIGGLVAAGLAAGAWKIRQDSAAKSLTTTRPAAPQQYQPATWRLPPVPATQYQPPATAAPGYSSPTPAAATIATPKAPDAIAIIAPPAPAVGPGATDINQAYDDALAAGRANQAQYYDTYQANIQQRVAAGDLVKGTAAYQEQVDYLANRGGVVNQAAELEKLKAAGLGCWRCR